MLDGASRIGEVVAAAAADGQPAVGITDHGNMYGVLDCYTAARDAGVTPVLGMEAYFTNTSRFDRPEARRARDLPPHAARRDRARATATSSRSRAARTSTATTTSPASTASCSSGTTRASPPRPAASAALVSQLILAGRRRRPRSRPRRASRTSSAATTSSSSCRTTASPSDATVNPPLLDIARKLQRAAARDQRQPLHAPATTPRRTTRCCACRPARCRATRSASSSTATSST